MMNQVRSEAPRPTACHWQMSLLQIVDLKYPGPLTRHLVGGYDWDVHDHAPAGPLLPLELTSSVTHHLDTGCGHWTDRAQLEMSCLWPVQEDGVHGGADDTERS